jgi:hypothetical protein
MRLVVDGHEFHGYFGDGADGRVCGHTPESRARQMYEAHAASAFSMSFIAFHASIRRSMHAPRPDCPQSRAFALLAVLPSTAAEA